MKNTSKHSFRFRRCPSYYEELLGTATLTYTLNCRSVGTIAPGESVLFAMELRVPRHAPLGNNGLIWELAPHTYNPPNTIAAVFVAR